MVFQGPVRLKVRGAHWQKLCAFRHVEQHAVKVAFLQGSGTSSTDSPLWNSKEACAKKAWQPQHPFGVQAHLLSKLLISFSDPHSYIVPTLDTFFAVSKPAGTFQCQLVDFAFASNKGLHGSWHLRRYSFNVTIVSLLAWGQVRGLFFFGGYHFWSGCEGIPKGK